MLNTNDIELDEVFNWSIEKEASGGHSDFSINDNKPGLVAEAYIFYFLNVQVYTPSELSIW